MPKSSFGPIVEGHLTLFSHPAPSKAAKPPKPIPFRGYKLRQQSTFQNLFSFMMLVESESEGGGAAAGPQKPKGQGGQGGEGARGRDQEPKN